MSSFASEELRSLRDAELSQQECGSPLEPPALPELGIPAPPAPPAPRPPATQAPPAPRTASRSSSGSPAEARQALMDAIRSGTGAARLRKVTVGGRAIVRGGPGRSPRSHVAVSPSPQGAEGERLHHGVACRPTPGSQQGPLRTCTPNCICTTPSALVQGRPAACCHANLFVLPGVPSLSGRTLRDAGPSG